MTDAYKEFGTYLRQYREERGLHLREVARNAEMSHAYLSQVERGEPRSLSDEKLMALGKALGHDSMAELFARAGRIPPLERDILRENATEWSAFLLHFLAADSRKVTEFMRKVANDLPKMTEEAEVYLFSCSPKLLGQLRQARHGKRKRKGE